MEFDTKSLDSGSTESTYYSNFVVGAPAASLFTVRVNTYKDYAHSALRAGIHRRGGAADAV